MQMEYQIAIIVIMYLLIQTLAFLYFREKFQKEILELEKEGLKKTLENQDIRIEKLRKIALTQKKQIVIKKVKQEKTQTIFRYMPIHIYLKRKKNK